MNAKKESTGLHSLTRIHKETKIDDLTMRVIDRGKNSVTLRITNDTQDKPSGPYNLRVFFMPDITL